MALDLSAQEKRMPAMNWNIATILPPMDKQLVSHGFAGPVTGVSHNRMIVAGGANFPETMPWLGGKKRYYDEVYVLDKCGNQVCVATEKFRLPEPIAYAACATVPAGLVYAGGENEKGISNHANLLVLDTGKDDLHIRALPNLPLGVSSPAYAGYGNKLFLAGGESVAGTSNQFTFLDLDHTELGWQMLCPLPMPVSHALMVALERNGRPLLVLIGGRNRKKDGISDFYKTVFAFDPQKDKWEEWPTLPYELSAGTGVALGSESILLFGGDRGETFGQVEQLIVLIHQEQDSMRRDELIRQKNLLLMNHPGFSREMLRYSCKTGVTEKMNELPYETPVTTTAVVWGQAVYIPSGEIRAGVRTPRILELTIPKELK